MDDYPVEGWPQIRDCNGGHKNLNVRGFSKWNPGSLSAWQKDCLSDPYFWICEFRNKNRFYKTLKWFWIHRFRNKNQFNILRTFPGSPPARISFRKASIALLFASDGDVGGGWRSCCPGGGCLPLQAAVRPSVPVPVSSAPCPHEVWWCTPFVCQNQTSTTEGN